MMERLMKKTRADLHYGVTHASRHVTSKDKTEFKQYLAFISGGNSWSHTSLNWRIFFVTSANFTSVIPD